MQPMKYWSMPKKQPKVRKRPGCERLNRYGKRRC